MTGVVLAGGAGSRLGAVSKPATRLAGRALIEWPLEALGKLCDTVAVVCKAATAIPSLPPGVGRWNEPDEPRHPLTGIVHALERCGGAVLVCAADMPFLDPGALRALATGPADAPAVVATAGGRLQPVLGLYRPAALTALGAAPAGEPLTRTVERLRPALVELAEETVASVNTPEELAAAELRLSA